MIEECRAQDPCSNPASSTVAVAISGDLFACQEALDPPFTCCDEGKPCHDEFVAAQFDEGDPCSPP